VRTLRGRKKKLIVAFHFHLFSNQAGWKCDSCRSAGLYVRRRCGRSAAPAIAPARVVWARKDVALDTCPKSFVTAQSYAWLEEFLVRRKLGRPWPDELSARDVEAFLILQNELEKESQNA
jgi:hypothetical protein